MGDPHRPPTVRTALLLVGGTALLVAAALILLRRPPPVDREPEAYGILLVLSCVGTLVALRRAVALGRPWGFTAPAGLGVGGLLLLTPLPRSAGGWAMVVGAAALVAVHVPLWRRRPVAAVLVQAGGAVLATGAALLWTGGVPAPSLLPWLAGFLVLTIVGGRLEPLGPRSELEVAALAAAVLVGVPAALLWPPVGYPLLAAAILAVAGWLLRGAPAGRSRRPVSRASWHLRTGAVVVGWLAALVAVAVGHPFVPASRWLLVHLLVLGAASNAILVWSWHFTAALLRLPDRGTRRGQAVRLVVFNAGAVAAVAGTVTGRWAVLLGGGVAVAGVAGWHAGALLRHARRALPSRFGVTVRYYVAAGAVLPVGVALGVTMARGRLTDAGHARVVVAHAALNLLGWVGLTVVGTLVTLWPTMLRTRIADGAAQAARRALPVLLTGLAVAAGGALGGSRTVTAAGVLLYLGGLVAVAAPHLQEVRRAPPSDFATSSVLAGVGWLTGSLLALAAGLATAGSWVHAADRAGWLTAPLLAGFAAQVLLGALTYLVPVVLGGGPAAVRAAAATLNRGGPARVVMANAGLLLCVLPVPSLVRVFSSMLVLGALAAFLPLVLRAVVAGRRLRDQPPSTVDRPRPPAQRRTGLAAAGLAAVVLAGAAGVAADPAALGLPGTPAAAGVQPSGRTTTVAVGIEGMRFVPDAVEVPAGDRLVVVLANTGDQRHDLVLQTGARTPRLAPGERGELDAGVIGRDLDGWCSVAGHRQLGMVLHVRVSGAHPEEGGHHPDGGADEPSAARDIDLAAPPAPGFTAHDPVLPPAAPARTHRVRLTVGERQREVAPGVTQTLWTFGGTAPGPTLRGRVGDVFDITLVNDATIGHSIDFHAGALAPDRPMRTIEPGRSLTYRFTATRSGVWMYHCSTMPMSLHIANGMFGAVVIDPPDLAPVYREYVLVQSELYLGPQGGIADAGRIRSETPDLVVFNGYANQYDHAPIRVRVGERIRIWVLAAGPDRGSAYHVVGGQFDTVYREGAVELRPGAGRTGGSQVLGLSPGQGGFVELTLPEPGSYPFVSHSMVDAERGAHGIIRVTR